MLHHIQKLHKHPEHVRERVALGIAAILTFSIFAAWAMSFDSRLATLDFSAVGTEAAAVRESLGGLTVVDEREVAPVSPTAILKKKIGETYGDFREAVGY